MGALEAAGVVDEEKEMVTIRAAREDEVDRLSELARASKAHWGYTEAQLEAWSDDLTFSVALLRTSHTHVAELGGEPAGVYCLLPTDGDWTLEHFWISPRYMRRGVGRALLEHAARLAAEGGGSALAIDSDPGAEAFYRACGARRVGELAAPTDTDPERTRPQMILELQPAGPTDRG